MDKFTIKVKFTIKKATWKSPIVVRLKHLNQSLINSSPVAICSLVSYHSINS